MPDAGNISARPRALDLFCGAGGASVGLHRAGFDVVGVDHRPQLRYPFEFIQADALAPPARLADFDLIWASPPCQPFSLARNIHRGTSAPDLIPGTRQLLATSGSLTVIENVPGAPIRADFALTGCAFGLGVVRRRHFETNFWALHPEPWKPRNAVVSGNYTTVAGHGTPDRRGGPGVRVERWRKAMGIDWMTRDEIAQAVPPAYAEFIGGWAMRYLDRKAA
jgi:DNA (cytosine-5)-methyltransferase 1